MKLIRMNPDAKDVIFPFISANNWLGNSKSLFERFIIDFDKLESSKKLS